MINFALENKFKTQFDVFYEDIISHSRAIQFSDVNILFIFIRSLLYFIFYVCVVKSLV